MRQQQGLRGLTSILKEVLMWVKCCQVAFYATERLFRKGKVNRLILRNRHSHPNLQNSLISQQPPTWRQDFPPAKRLHLPEGPPHWTSCSALSAIRHVVFKDNTTAYLTDSVPCKHNFHMHWGTKRFTWLALLCCWLYRGGLEPSAHHLRAVCTRRMPGCRAAHGPAPPGVHVSVSRGKASGGCFRRRLSSTWRMSGPRWRAGGEGASRQRERHLLCQKVKEDH